MKGKTKRKVDVIYRCRNIIAGRWVYPKTRGYRLVCCDCGLTHRMDFGAIAGPRKDLVQVRFRTWRDDHATVAIRKRRGSAGKP